MAKKLTGKTEKETPVVEQTAEAEHVDLMAEQAIETNNDVKPEIITEGDFIQQNFQEETAQIEPEPEPKPEAEKPNEEPVDEMPLTPKEMAEYTVGALDMAQTMALPRAYKWANFTTEEKTIIRKIKRLELVEETPEVVELRSRYKDFEEYQEGLPFTPDETKTLKKNFERVFQKINFKLTPEMALLISVLFIIGSRLLPLCTGLVTKFTNSNED